MISPQEFLNDEVLWDRLATHAMAWFPDEACGLLIEGVDGPRLELAENLADKYHKLDPETYSRTARTSYLLDPLLLANVERRGERVVAIFHSHVRVGAYFSDEDIAQALSPFEEGPMYPGIDYVVLDAQDDGVRGYKVFGWNDTRKEFSEK
jgi:[CysO sulfur-carrier protein]-S-L-cysteine hydrolase